MIRTLIALSLVLPLTACAGFKLGGMAYCPFGQACTFSAAPPASAAK